MLRLEFGISETLAPTLASLPFFISAGVAPFLGVIVDKVGRRGIFSKLFIILTIFSWSIKFFGVLSLHCDHNYTYLRLHLS